MGMIDRGADLSWLSQYPHEAELLFSPLTGCEIIDLDVEGALLVAKVRLSVRINNAGRAYLAANPLLLFNPLPRSFVLF